jgi:hypothetical protein
VCGAASEAICTYVMAGEQLLAGVEQLERVVGEDVLTGPVEYVHRERP